MDWEKQIRTWKEVDFLTADINTFKDIREVKVNTALSKEERMKDYLQQIGNPYCFRCDKIAIEVVHGNTNRFLMDCLGEEKGKQNI